MSIWTADALSPREQEVLHALAGHATNAEIAARLFISVRTVESHVAALLRKAGAADRRTLIARAPELLGGEERPRATRRSTLTSFVGRQAERDAIGAALQEHRLVTALGPGGVGKTRLALEVLADVTEGFRDGGWVVDLVVVTEPGQVPSAIAAVLGIHERQGHSLADAVASWLADREVLLVLDNCEHLVDGVAALLEQLLLAAPRLKVLATSRTRLAVPFERVYAVPGLSTASGDEPGDAVRLFEARAAAAGATLGLESRQRVAAVCGALDGMALSIELAAARLPAIGLDGLEAALGDRLPLLSGGRRADDRHRSLRATLDWSYALLSPVDRAVLRRVSAFAAPFSAVDAAVVAGDAFAPAAVGGAVAELVDSSMLIAEHTGSVTRYRALETIRQYGAERLADAGEADAVHAAHLAWCLGRMEALGSPASGAPPGWQQELDAVVEDLRAALGWAAGRPEHRESGFHLAELLAEALYARGLPAEAQRRFEEAAGLAADTAAATRCLRAAAGAAEARQFGTESLRLRRRIAEALLASGDRAGAAIQVARAAELINRGPGILVPRPDPGDAQPLLDEARSLAGDDPLALSRVLVAEAFAAGRDGTAVRSLAEEAVRSARRTGDPIGESAALDALCAQQLEDGDLADAAGSALRRVRILDALPSTPGLGMELPDALAMSTECAIGIGDLALAGRLADRLLALPYYGGEQHLGAARGLLVGVLVGDITRCVALAARFFDGWERAGRPSVSNLSPSALAAAAAFELAGDDPGATRWREIARLLLTRRLRSADFEVSSLEALALLHRGRPADAVARMQADPERIDSWYEAVWRPWYAALRAEAAVLAGTDDAPVRVARGRSIAAPNPVAAALLDRAAALPARDASALAAVADRLDALGARYQAARTRILAGGALRRQGEAAMAACGVTPMVVPAA